jgi:hypothetical protein
MLEKSLFSPARPLRAETRFSPGGVLASLRGSTYRSVRLASSLAAALPDSLFEYPVRNFHVVQDMQISDVVRAEIVFPLPINSLSG